MKRIRKNILMIGLISAFCVAPCNLMIVNAMEVTGIETAIKEDKELLRADIIEKKYRVHKGVLQYRHWNRTRGCWVEDHWIDMTH